MILIAGFSRGGTNILWNILQSHPQICAPKHETGVLLNYSDHLIFGKLCASARKVDMASSLLMKKLIDFQLYKYKMNTLTDENNKYRSENVLYSKKEVSEAAFCLKSVDDDIFLTDELLSIYPSMSIIFLTRNGYALANGHKRRNNSIEATANLYCRIGKKMGDLLKKHEKSLIINFENILKDPFIVSEKLYRFISVTPTSIPKLRFKSKKIIRHENVHEVQYGEENRKYWFDKEETASFLDPEINKKQIAHLSSSEIKVFNSIAESQLKKFGYNIL